MAPAPKEAELTEREMAIAKAAAKLAVQKSATSFTSRWASPS